MNTRPTGVEGSIVDAGKLQELANLPAKPWALLALTLADGRTAVVCEEGVGWYVKDNSLLIPMDYGEQEVPVETVLQAVTEDKRDLSTFIRTFGGRLETNFWLWYNAVNGPDTPKEKQ